MNNFHVPAVPDPAVPDPSTPDPAAAAGTSRELAFDGLWHWLLDAAEQEGSIDLLFAAFCRELARHCPIFWRGSLGLEILHPEVGGSMLVWTTENTAEMGQATRTDFARVPDRGNLAYRNSPTRIVFETGEPFRRRLDRSSPDLPVLDELREAGATDYVMMPLPFVDRSRIANMSFSTRRAGGFDPAEIEALGLAARLFSPYAERHVLQRIAVDLLDTYIGPRTGHNIIAGHVVRGSTETVEAAIWLADLRGFTAFSEENPVAVVVAALNSWLETMIEALDAHDGEVLKFIGDAVLAIFPTADRSREQACADAFAAATAFSSRIEAAGGGPGLDFSLSLHFGEVAYGNIGAPRRLDFTVIGPAVNRAARLQELAKALGRTILASNAFAASLDQPLRRLGAYRLRGIEKPEPVFGL